MCLIFVLTQCNDTFYKNRQTQIPIYRAPQLQNLTLRGVVLSQTCGLMDGAIYGLGGGNGPLKCFFVLFFF